MVSARTGNKTRLKKELITWVGLFCVVVAVSLLFVWSVQLRQPWFGGLSREGHQWLTGSTIKFVQNWLRDDPWKIRFLQLENPASIELPNLMDREPYVSYPPGTNVPVYLASLLREKRVSPGLVMGINLANQYCIAVILVITCFLLLKQRRLSYFWVITLAIIPGAIYIFLPGNMYWHQNVYYSDQAVMLPFVAYVCMEVLRYEGKAERLWVFDVLQAAVALYGASVDYLFWVMGGVILLKRIILGQFGFKQRSWLKKLAVFGLPFMAGPAFFAYQLAWSGTFNQLKEMFLFRTALSVEGVETMVGNFFEKVWIRHLNQSFCQLGRYILWTALFSFGGTAVYYRFFYEKRKSDPDMQNLIVFASLALLPCLLQTFLLRNHSYVHNFSVLKYSFFLAVYPFVLLPVILDRSQMFKAGEEKLLQKAIYGHAVVLAVLFLMVVGPGFQERFYSPSVFIVEQFINEHTGYEEVVFSPGFEIKALPPQSLAMSEKLVHKYDQLSEVALALEKIPGNFPVMFFIDETWATPQPDSLDDLAPIIAQAEASYRKDSYWLYKIMKSDLMPLIEP
jgi:hypothetical protein